MVYREITRFLSVVDLPSQTDLTLGDGDTPENDLPLSDDVNHLVLSVTYNQWLRLFSAALNGAYDTYPDDYTEVFYPLLKAAKVTFCAAMLECLNNDPDVRNAINQIAKDAINALTEITDGNTFSGTRGLGTGCDPDTLWGQTTKLVDFMNSVNVDFFEQLDLLAEASDRVEAWLDIVPVLGDVVEAVVNTVTETGAALLASYNASWNDSLRDQISCDLFCLAQEQDGCQLTLQQVLDFFLDRYNLSSGGLGPLATLQMLASFSRMGLVIAQGGGFAYSGDDMVYIAMIVQLSAVVTGQKYFNIESVGTYYNEMYDSIPSFGWESECDPCGSEWSHTVDLTDVGSLPDYIDLQGFSFGGATFNAPVFSVGLGVVGSRYPSMPQNLRGLQIRIGDETAMSITGIDAWVLSDAPRDPYGTLIRTFIDSVQKSQLLEYTDGEELYISEVDFTEDSTSDGVVIYALNDVTANPSTDGLIYLQRFTLRGTGTKPAIFT